MKVILSRKGFDSAAGGHPSPHFVSDGRLLSLPIPEDKRLGGSCLGSTPTYSSLRFDGESSYLAIMEKLGLSGFASRRAHLDPDINAAVIDRSKGWRGLFGQCSSAQAHLSNKGVSCGDLFLFFGWYRDVEQTDRGYRYLGGTDKHIIWGYLQVGEIESIKAGKQYESWKEKHPHYLDRDRHQNTAYIASDRLSFDPTMPGCGVFSYDASRVLTCPEAGKRSVWRLPECFHPEHGTRVSYHENTKLWSLRDDGHCTLHSVGRGQEFVIEGNDDAILDWVRGLL